MDLANQQSGGAAAEATQSHAGLPGFSHGKLVNDRFCATVREFIRSGRMDTLLERLPFAATVRAFIMQAVTRWITAFDTVGWGHQVQQRVEYVLRCGLAIALVKQSSSKSASEGLAVASVLQLPLSSDGSSCVRVPKVLMSLGRGINVRGTPCDCASDCECECAVHAALRIVSVAVSLTLISSARCAVPYGFCL